MLFDVIKNTEEIFLNRIIKRIAIFLLFLTVGVGLLPINLRATNSIGDVYSFEQEGNILIFNSGINQVKVELCTERTVRIQLSRNSDDGYRPYDVQYYMVQKNAWPTVERAITDEGNYYSVKTNKFEVRIQKQPLRIGMYDLEGNLISKDSDETGMHWNNNTVGVRKEENLTNSGGIFGFGSGDHGRRENLNRYNEDFNEFSMSHGRVISPFFMSTVGYGIFLNTIEKNTIFFSKGSGFQTEGYLDYFFMFGPDFKTIQNEYAEVTGRMELYGKWAHGFMLSKYGNDNATQAEFLEWLHRLRDEGYPTDSYVFDYGWRGDVSDNGGNQTGAGEKWGKQMWSNDITKFPDIDAMLEEARDLGFRIGLHNNAGTPEASGGDKLYLEEYERIWVESYMNSVIKTGYGDWFWPDEFDVLGSNTAPVFSSKGAYEAWKEYTVESRPMFITRGSYAGHHYATAWSGDINNTSAELINQIGFSLDAGLIGYWASSNDLGGFMKKPTDELYTRWVAQFGAWSGIMRAHGHDGREPWLYDNTAQETLKENLRIRYSLYPYIYNMAWQGYREGVPMMRAMILEDGSQYNPDAWDLNKQYYFGDWFLVAPAADTSDTVVSVWLPPETTWYNYYTGKRYEGGRDGKTITVAAPLEEIPVFVKAGAIIPMGPNVNYVDEVPLDPLTLDIYPLGTTTYTLHEDDGLSRKYLTENAYSTTTYTSIEDGNNILFKIAPRIDYNPEAYQPDARSYNLKFNHLGLIHAVTLNGNNMNRVYSLDDYNNAEEAYWLDEANEVLYVKVVDNAQEMTISIDSDGIRKPEAGEENQGMPPKRIESGDLFELEEATFLPVVGGQVEANNEWKGYTGSGFAKGFKLEGDALEFKVNIVRDGTYSLILRVNNGKKNNPLYDSTPRTGGLYINGEKVSGLSFTVTDTWGDSNKNGIWLSYKLENINLKSGMHNIKIVSEGPNPGNYNLDSIKFERLDTSIDAFSNIEAEKAARLNNLVLQTEEEATYISTTNSGAWAQFNEVRGHNKAGIRIRLKSSTGGSIIIYENGVGDKILSTVELPNDNKWTIVDVNCKDTDAVESNIYFEFIALQGESIDVSVDWFGFVRKVNAYEKINAALADYREDVNVRDNRLVNIYDGSWVRFDDFDFGDGGVKTILVTAATQRPGGTISIYIDDMNSGIKIGEVEITSTGSWTSTKRFLGDIDNITGIHDIYFKFNTSTGQAICDLFDFRFSKNNITVDSEVKGSNISIQVSDDMANAGTTVIFQLVGKTERDEIDYIEVKDSLGNIIEYNMISDIRYSIVIPENVPVKISVKVSDKPVVVETGSVLELEDGTGITNDSNNGLRIDKEWPGYSGSGYVAGWKTVGNYVEVRVEIKETGMYTLILRGAAGLKNESKYDLNPRTGALYIDNFKVGEFGLQVQNHWGTWIEYTFDPIHIEAGIRTIRLVSEGNVNPGNYNLDRLTFKNGNVVNKAKLKKLIEEVNNLDEINYTFTSWTSLQNILVNSIAVFNNESVTQTQIDEAYFNLLSAKINLEEKEIISKFELHVLIAELMSLNDGDYSEETWSDLQNALDFSFNIYYEDNATDDQIYEAYQKLLNAQNNLEELEVEEEPKKQSKWWIWTICIIITGGIGATGMAMFRRKK